MSEPLSDEPIAQEPLSDDQIAQREQQVAKQIHQLLTPVSILIGIDLTVFLYFIDQNWDRWELLNPSLALLVSVVAFFLILIQGIMEQWIPKLDEERRYRLGHTEKARTVIFWLIMMSLFLFFFSLTELFLFKVVESQEKGQRHGDLVGAMNSIGVTLSVMFIIFMPIFHRVYGEGRVYHWESRK